MMTVYWIHHKDHTDIFNQGYVGISKNLVRRFQHHSSRTQNSHFKNAIKKYGWKNLIKQQILIAEKDYCLYVEERLRPKDNIGWNIVKGGGLPPLVNNKGKKRTVEHIEKFRQKMLGRKFTDEHKAKISLANIGRIVTNETREKIRQGNLGKTKPMKGKQFSTIKCPHCDVVGGINCMQRWHMDNCKFKEIQ